MKRNGNKATKHNKGKYKPSRYDTTSSESDTLSESESNIPSTKKTKKNVKYVTLTKQVQEEKYPIHH